MWEMREREGGANSTFAVAARLDLPFANCLFSVCLSLTAVVGAEESESLEADADVAHQEEGVEHAQADQELETAETNSVYEAQKHEAALAQTMSQ